MKARRRGLRCDAELNLGSPYYVSVQEILRAIRKWEAINGSTCGAIGWERQLMGANE
jgi:hypothetical protein